MLRRFSEYCRLYAGLSYLGIVCLTAGTIALLLHPLLPVRWGRPLGRRVITLIFRSYVRFLILIGACRFDLTELDALRAEPGGLILAPNHPSLLDAVMVISRLPNVACIMKSELMDNAFLGGGARLARYIRNDPPLRMTKQAVAALKSGSCLLIFPEGTRTVSPPFNPCKASIGLIAKRARAPVQTVLIETDSAFLSKGWSLFRRPAMPMTYRIRLGKRFPAPPLAETSTDFMAKLEAYFHSELTQSKLQPPRAPAALPLTADLRERSPYA